MKSFRKELWFETSSRREYINITPEIRQVLENELKDDINKFRELTGKAFDEWDI